MNHKYGFHVNRTGDDVLDAIKRIKPGVIKTLDPNVGFWTRVRAAQRAEHLGSGEVRVYYVTIGDWGNVAYHQRETEIGPLVA